MNDSRYHELREASWRRNLTAGEEAQLNAWLAAHPEAKADWESQTALNRALDQLPDAPVPSNFTARVLQAVEQETANSRPRALKWRWTFRSLLPRVALAAVVLGILALSHERRQAAERTELARDVARVSNVAAVLNPRTFQDFETIRRFGQTPSADNDLLALLE